MRIPTSRPWALISMVVVANAALATASDAPLDLVEALRLAGGDQPQVAALAQARQAALEAARAEAELPDPRLTIGALNLPVTGEDAWRLDRDDMTMIGVGVMQEVSPRGARRAASGRLRAEAAALEAEARASGRSIRRDAGLAWLDAWEAARRGDAWRELLAIASRERETELARAGAEAGYAAAALRLDSMISMLRDRSLVAERDERRARAALARWIGAAAERPLPRELPHSPAADDAPATVESVPAAHPVIEAAARSVEAAQLDLETARAQRTPQWSWELMYGRRSDGRSDMVNVQFAVALPLNRHDRQDRRIARSRALAERMRFELLARERELQAELATARADAAASAARMREHVRRLLPAARMRLAAAESAYASGRGALGEIWEARRALVEATLEHEALQAEGLRAALELAWLTATEEAPT